MHNLYWTARVEPPTLWLGHQARAMWLGHQAWATWVGHQAEVVQQEKIALCIMLPTPKIFVSPNFPMSRSDLPLS